MILQDTGDVGAGGAGVGGAASTGNVNGVDNIGSIGGDGFGGAGVDNGRHLLGHHPYHHHNYVDQVPPLHDVGLLPDWPPHCAAWLGVRTSLLEAVLSHRSFTHAVLCAYWNVHHSPGVAFDDDSSVCRLVSRVHQSAHIDVVTTNMPEQFGPCSVFMEQALGAGARSSNPET